MKILPLLRRFIMGLPLSEELGERIAAGLEGETAAPAGASEPPFMASHAAESEFPKDLIEIDVPENILLAVTTATDPIQSFRIACVFQDRSTPRRPR